MKKQTFWLENLLKKIFKNFNLLTFVLILLCSGIQAKEKWGIDKKISKIIFEVPVLFAANVKGEFKNFDGFVEIDLDNKTNNKAIISVDISSIELNYQKYKELILSSVFF